MMEKKQRSKQLQDFFMRCCKFKFEVLKILKLPHQSYAMEPKI